MRKISQNELKRMFIENVQSAGDDAVIIFGVEYSKIRMLEDADPIHFDIALTDYIYSLVEDGVLEEGDSEYMIVSEV